MESAQLTKWVGCAILLLALTAMATTDGKRPEAVLAEVLTKPFVPREFASPQCIRDSELYLEALDSYTPWALQMYDSSVKIPSGLITGNYRLLGNFDECLRVKSTHGFIGQACHAEVQFDIAAEDVSRRKLDLGDLLLNVAIASNASNWTSGKTIVYEWMWCVPSTCTHNEIQEALELALDPLKVERRVDMTVSVSKNSCHTVESDRKIWSIDNYCYISLLALFALIIVISTGYDIVTQRQMIRSKLNTIFTPFSLYTNGKNLLRTDRSRQNSIDCLDGLRFISMCWIIYGHTHYMEVVNVKLNLAEVPHMHHEWMNMLVLNANIVTDSFLVLSGLLLAYTVLSKRIRDSKWRFNVLKMYIHRYARLTPAYAMLIGFYATLFYKFGSGPYWDLWVGSNQNYCRENWWTNLLYVNNYVNVPGMCISQSWYLSLEMQLTWLSPLVLYPMLNFRTLFLGIILGVYMLLSFLVPFVITYLHKLTGTMLYYKDQMNVILVYLEIYTKIYTRFGPYVIGLVLGYVLHKTKGCNVKLRVWQVIIGWLIAILAGAAVIFGPRSMYTHEYDRLEASFYAGLHRQIFALSISWIIFCCVHGYAGPINHLLSWHGWILMSKLSYCAYLTHYVFLLSNVGATRIAGNLTSLDVMRTFLANLALTLMLSVIWSLCFEMPFITIDRILFSKCKEKSSKDKQHGGSTESGKSICQLENESALGTSSMITLDDNNAAKLADERRDSKTTEKNRREVAGRADEETERRSPGNVYVINPELDGSCTFSETKPRESYHAYREQAGTIPRKERSRLNI